MKRIRLTEHSMDFVRPIDLEIYKICVICAESSCKEKTLLDLLYTYRGFVMGPHNMMAHPTKMTVRTFDFESDDSIDESRIKIVLWGKTEQLEKAKLKSHPSMKNYFARASCLVLLFDKTNPYTPEMIHDWAKLSWKWCGEQIPKVLIGIEADLDHQEGVVSHEQDASVFYVDTQNPVQIHEVLKKIARIAHEFEITKKESAL